jgi:hypothetical protein
MLRWHFHSPIKRPLGKNAMRLSIETLNAAYYRQRALDCYTLAGTAQAAKPLFMRLCILAQAYDERAKIADSEDAGETNSLRLGSGRIR